jgi:hypothetical protein
MWLPLQAVVSQHHKRVIRPVVWYESHEFDPHDMMSPVPGRVTSTKPSAIWHAKLVAYMPCEHSAIRSSIAVTLEVTYNAALPMNLAKYSWLGGSVGICSVLHDDLSGGCIIRDQRSQAKVPVAFLDGPRPFLLQQSAGPHQLLMSVDSCTPAFECVNDAVQECAPCNATTPQRIRC